MENTGERYLPECDGDWSLEHVHRYLVACEFAAEKDVLDIASGEGYGSAMLAEVARHVVGVDIAEEAVEWAQGKYRRDNLEFLKGSAASIPLEDASVDLVVSFETIEHLAEHDVMMTEIKRVLRPDGILVVSSPEKHEYTDIHGTRNRFHVRELYFREFEDLLRRHFTHHRMCGQNVVWGSIMGSGEGLLSWKKDEKGSRTVGILNPKYLVAVAGNVEPPEFPSSLFEGDNSDSDMARDLNRRLAAERTSLEALEQRHAELEQRHAELEQRHAELEQRHAELEQRKGEMEAELAALKASTSWKMTRPFRHMSRRLQKFCGKIVHRTENGD